MNRDAANFNLKDFEYPFAFNTMFESESGDSYNPKNELSNELAALIPAGFKVVGFKKDIQGERTIFWITNPDTKDCEIGYIKNGGAYIKLTSSPDLNFDITKPIKKIVLKYEKSDTVAYWTDDLNPDRHIILSSVKDFLTEGSLDVDKLRIDSIYSLPTITPVSIEAGGQLEKGVYEVSATYCDKLGNEIAGYITTTNPIHIYDNHDRIMDNTELNEKSNQAIKLKVDNLDPQYKYYKVIVVQKLLDSTSYFIEGIHPINDREIIIPTVQGKERTDINKLLATKTTWVKSRGITSSNGYLFRYGLTAEKEINLQPISNLLGAFVKWQTVEAKEDLYSRGESAALYRGYFRDEVYPLSWRFRTNKGYISANFPLVARPATIYRDEESNEVIDELAVVDNQDSKSVNELSPDCSTEDRNKHWQFYNTAHGVERFTEFTGETTLITQPVVKYCVSSDFNKIESKTIYLDLEDVGEFKDLKSYIEEFGNNLVNKVPENLRSSFDNQAVQDILEDERPEINCEPYFKKGSCDNPVLQENDTKVYLGEVLGESIKLNTKEAVDYQRSRLQAPSAIHEFNTEGGGKRDEEFINEFNIDSDPRPFVRRVSVEAGKCSYAKEIQVLKEASDKSLGIIPQYYGEYVKEDLYQDVIAEPRSGGFFANIHKGATWLKGKIKTGDKAFIEIPKWVTADFDDTFWVMGNTKMRVSVFTGRCSSLKLLKTFVVDVKEGDFLYDDPINKSELFDDEFYIALDFPIKRSIVGTSHWVTAVPHGTIGIEVRAEEFKSAEVYFDRLTTHKQQKYVVDCTYEVPVFNECEPQPHKNGKFAYWESIEKYPDNKELYDSSVLEIDVADIPESIRKDFEEYFVSSRVGTKYKLKQATDLSNKPIRHFKFPDFSVAPFMSTNLITPFSESLIYPLGITISKEAINSFLDIAVKNELLTQEQRESIEEIEIFRGDRRVNKSILGKGIAFDMYDYEEESTGKKVLFPNFPYNDLGDNELVYRDDKKKDFVAHPYRGLKNNKFTWHSPEYDYYNQNIGSEVKVEAYQFGRSRGSFTDVQKHPEWVILGKKAYRVATTLAVLEYALEVAIRFTDNLIDSSSNYWFTIGFANGGNPAGAITSTIATIALTAFEVLSNAAPVVGRYRYEWLKTFRDFGKPENFASQYSSEGFYNFAEPNNWFSGAQGSIGNSLRGVSTGKALKEGRFIYTERDGEQLRINNLDRERSLLLTFGEYPIDYPINYRTFDNNKVDKYASSRLITSDTGECVKGKSPEVQRNIASPYMTIKNYVPFQYNSISSVKWLPTGTTISLKGEESAQVFGGDIYISRYTIKRKTPLFDDNAYGVADMLPYEYSRNNNVGFPRFFCDYELGQEKDLGDILFPDFESDYDFDCQTSTSGMYVKAPSKFYLFYYGIPNFLVESEINLNLRYGKKEMRSSFYPEVGDYNEWTQEKNVSIREPNRLFYNNAYSSTVTPGSYRTLPDYYSKKEFDVIYDSPSGVIYSLQDNSENDLNDPWLVYRPLDKYQFPTSYGRLVDLEGVDSGRLFGRFENTSLIFNEVNDYREAQTAATREMGTGGVFDARPLEFSSTELGYKGSNTYQMVSNEYGHFYPDADRGQVFMYPGGKNSPIEISSNNGKESTGMKAWFKEHLPFKIKDTLVKNYETIDTDNALNGIGITMGWDAKYDRVFLTKIDYEPIKEMDYYDGKFMNFDCNPIQFCKIVNKEQTIQDKLDLGYKFIEEGCKIIFQKYSESCEYSTQVYGFPQDEIDALVNDGYTILAESGDTITLEKVVEVCDNNTKKAEIQALIDDGYKKLSEVGCVITFTKDVCSFTNQQVQIDNLINDGYTLIGETDCSKVFEKPDSPVSNEAKDDYVQVDQGGSTTFNAIANDISGSTQNLSIYDFTQPLNGVVTQVNGTNFKYVHNGSSTTTDSFTYRAENDLGVTNFATVTIAIAPFSLTVSPDETYGYPGSIGSSEIIVNSTHPWTSELVILDQGYLEPKYQIQLDKTSGGIGTTTIVASWNATTKGLWRLLITSRGTTISHTITVD